MDKNSVTGLVLITLILGVFWWMNKPSEEELAKQRELNRQNQIAALQEKEAAKDALPIADKITESIADTTSDEELKAKFGSFSNAIKGETEFSTLENNLVKITFSNKGGKVYSVELKDFKTYDEKPLILFDGENNTFGFNFYHNNKPFNTNNLFFNKLNSNSKTSIAYALQTADDQELTFTYSLPEDSYMIDMTMSQKNMDGIIQTNRGSLDFDWKVDVFAQEKGRKNELQNSGIFFKYDQDDIDEIQGKSGEEEIRTPLKWVAYKDQFFASVFIAKDKFTSGSVAAVVNDIEGSQVISTNKSSLVIPYEGGIESSQDFQFYYGPNHYLTLRKYKDIELHKMIPLGWGIFGWINRFVVIPVFNWLEGSIASYGLIILILTLLIKVALFPLTYKSYMSSAKMRVLKPQIDAINEKIPADKAMERQQATMGLYRKAGVSPLGGCLPMLLQMPILFAMFRFFPASIELRGESFLWATDLSTYDSIFEWTTNIPLISSFYGNHISLFTLLMAVTNIVYTKMNQEMTASTSQMPGMKSMMYMMPIMFLFIFNNYAAGLSYYYFISTLITILQTVLIRRFVDEEAILAKLNANQKKPQKKKSGFQARLEEMAKQQQKAKAAQKKK